MKVEPRKETEEHVDYELYEADQIEDGVTQMTVDGDDVISIQSYSSSL